MFRPSHAPHEWCRPRRLRLSAGDSGELPAHTPVVGGGSAPLKADCIFCGNYDELGNLFGYYAHVDCKEKYLKPPSKDLEGGRGEV